MQTDKENTDPSDNEQHKDDITPKTLQSNLYENRPTKVVLAKGNKKGGSSSKKLNKGDKSRTPERVEKKIAIGKKDYYNPNEDFPNNVSFEPSKLQKKQNKNDVKLVESAGAIRKFK